MGPSGTANKWRGAVRHLPHLAWLLFLLTTLLGLADVSRADALLAATSYKMAGDATKMRIVVAFDREPEVKWFLLRGPNRLVIDLPRTRFAVIAKDTRPRGLVRAVRYGDQGQGSRLILTGKGPFAVDKLDVLKNDEGSGYRIAIDMSAASEREFDEALANQSLTTGSTVSTDKGARVGTGPVSAPGHRFTIVIDPGHGGVDGGAESAGGTVEKNVTLAFATELRDKLAAVGSYDVFMTRDKDEYLTLDDRVRIARQHEADLLISIHADTINVRGIRGATVYTLSDKASDPEAQALADRENLSDQFAGLVIKDDNKEVTDILIDLIRRETHSFSMSFAHTLVGQLSTSVGLINNPQRSAGFKVLKAPDVPSVLVELGYLSNTKDEAQLLSADWRGKAAQSITNAVALFAAAKTGTQTGG
ncbi:MULTISPECIES: N-acetylmuramoyl-L-alanine amidase [unclassified Mesorhizobium]|uniref:N-acetylmuramoyl-L-alanine amidase n=1 Tax=unclassified Mesorhizobium TaxID=325217 RepID=UPI000BAEE54E|nr:MULTISPECIES: N-acetylmuramoyl-L-alanine amidase [unclassified Mesorhizobium]TGT60090.1 N-acetylmuramoyl-L-alanine amidase [Mesorhizobium sp. M00.F.Ca.ET.170.01.1.1]AZO08252.1 N-acetylmuramoyl-L-alanine amidase [Mesorhizobium sp. M3A.F.Ca.ET.080.04.2.1]PBB85654.1 N-acetylmuramoyl-L-alanine amidase [Mesorhizobium sp. WSM3876]RWB71008.1 MAG: N-acetylmuramoyl-L-alanine amidase [Mesorhizobium sp.]RWB89269.1 MAG: N-acetylmuramoyl-L-alanine amidase [Mesorhizobium sp.]